MMRRSTTVVLLIAAIFAAACAVPFGPNYSIERQQVWVTYSLQSPGRVHVNSTYRLKNAGERELTGVRAELPLAAQNLRATTNGVALAPGPAEKQESSVIVPLPFASPLHPKAHLQLIIEFDLETRGSAFYFSDREWFCELLPPDVPLASGRARAGKAELTIRVPENYRALSGSIYRGQKRRGAEREFRFRFRDTDFDLSLLAGPYLVQRISAAGTTVFLWTLKPIPSDEAQRAADRITQTTRLYENALGPRRRSHDPVWIVDFPTSWRATQPAVEALFLSTFPRGALVNLTQVNLDRFRTSTAGPNLSASLDLALAELWFSHLAVPDPDIGVLNFALSAYAQRLARDAQGTPADRHALIAAEIARFDVLLGGAKDVSILSLQPPVSGAQLRPARQKALLFLFAIEEKVGKKNLLAGIKRLMQAVRGSAYSWDELRAAVEGESHTDLAELTRLWLNQPGIPTDFRARYADQKPLGQK